MPTRDDRSPVTAVKALAEIDDEASANDDFEEHNERHAYVRIAGLGTGGNYALAIRL